MAILKLLSDFDGVWTNQETEAEYVYDFITQKISELSGDSPDTIKNLFQQCRKDMDSSAYEYGWFCNGSIAAYYQEDPFGDHNAILDYINRSASKKSYSNFKQHLAKIKDVILHKAHKTLAEFSNECFMKATTQFKLEGKLKPVETAETVVKELNSLGVQIVVVSNSKTEKIEHLFFKASLKATTDNSKRGKLHARGDAKKFIIDNNYTAVPEYLEITDKYKVSLRRSHYHKILIEEKPDYVLGDVFSLDLALPLYLRLHDKNFPKLKVIQKVQKHTPGWVKDYLSKDEFKGIAFMAEDIREVPGIVKH